LVYWIGSAFFSLVDLTGRPAWVLQYRIQDNKQVPVSIIVEKFKSRAPLAGNL
jgi:hypothetical protein